MISWLNALLLLNPLSKWVKIDVLLLIVMCFLQLEKMLGLNSWIISLNVTTFQKIRHIYLLADGGNWIKNGLHELKLYAQNKPQFCLCEFHFKQAINHISSDKDERKNLLEIFNTKPFEEFKKRIDELIVINPNRKETITNKYNYIKNNKSAIKRMLNLILVHLWKAIFLILLLPCSLQDPKGFSTKKN